MNILDSMELMPVAITARVIESEYGFTILTEDAGGPVITASTKEEAEAKFSEALAFSHAIRNLNYFKEALLADDKNMDEYVKEIKKTDLNISFVDVCK